LNSGKAAQEGGNTVIINVSHLVMAFLMGMGAGIVYFGGLWWTVRQLPFVRQPALLTLGSFFVRTGISLTAFYLASGGHWERILTSLLGFIVMRGLLVRRVRAASTRVSAN
jgi:F1F0 ATPase subunit 2